MQKLAKLSLTIIVSALFFGGLTVSETPAQVLQEILKRMDAHQKSLTTLRSKITVNQYNSQLQESDNYQGTAIYSRTADYKISGKLDWLKPAQETISLMDTQYVLYRPRLHQAIMGNLDKTNGNDLFIKQISFLSMSKQDIKAYYSIRFIGFEKIKGETETVHLELIPKITTNFKTAELWVDKDGMPLQVKVNQPSNDSTTILFFDFKKNELINPSELKISLPKTTSIIRTAIFNCVCPKIEDAKNILRYKSDAVFSGKVIAVTDDNYTFKTEKIWKGAVSNEITLKDFSKSEDCEVMLTTGERYIVFARNINLNGKVLSAIPPCNLTNNLSSESGKKIFKLLGKSKSVKKAVVRKKRISPKKIAKTSVLR